MFNINAMKALKIVGTMIAWLGIFITLIGFVGMIWVNIDDLTHLHAYSYSDPTFQNNFRLWFIVGLFFSIPGIVIAIFGGIIARPRYYWPVLIAVGAIYCISNIIGIIVPVLERNFFISESIWSLLPGMLCIIGGLVIRWLRKRESIRLKGQISISNL